MNALKMLGNIYETMVSKDISDDYIMRLRQINTGMLTKGNLFCFDYVMKHIVSQSPILEIGSFCGLSTNAISYYKQLHGRKNRFFSCDKWDYGFKNLDSRPIGRSSITGEEWGRFAKETFVRNVSFFSKPDLPFSIEVYSDEFFVKWHSQEDVTDVFGREVKLGGSFSFCYIDGNHDYEYVARDFHNCSKHLENGGYILFDDSSRFAGSPGVVRLMKEIQSSDALKKQYELTLINPNYLIRKK